MITTERNVENCTKCPAGYHGKDLDKHKNNQEYDSCDACPRGKYGSDAGSSNASSGCALCAVGRYLGKIGATTLYDLEED